MTAAEQLMERGRLEGRTQGRDAERREVLLEQLHARFGTLAKSVETRVRDADPAQLKRWLLRFVTASTVDEVLAET